MKKYFILVLLLISSTSLNASKLEAEEGFGLAQQKCEPDIAMLHQIRDEFASRCTGLINTLEQTEALPKSYCDVHKIFFPEEIGGQLAQIKIKCRLAVILLFTEYWHDAQSILDEADNMPFVLKSFLESIKPRIYDRFKKIEDEDGDFEFLYRSIQESKSEKEEETNDETLSEISVETQLVCRFSELFAPAFARACARNKKYFHTKIDNPSKFIASLSKIWEQMKPYFFEVLASRNGVPSKFALEADAIITKFIVAKPDVDFKQHFKELEVQLSQVLPNKNKLEITKQSKTESVKETKVDLSPEELDRKAQEEADAEFARQLQSQLDQEENQFQSYAPPHFFNRPRRNAHVNIPIFKDLQSGPNNNKHSHGFSELGNASPHEAANIDLKNWLDQDSNYPQAKKVFAKKQGQKINQKEALQVFYLHLANNFVSFKSKLSKSTDFMKTLFLDITNLNSSREFNNLGKHHKALVILLLLRAQIQLHESFEESLSEGAIKKCIDLILNDLGRDFGRLEGEDESVYDDAWKFVTEKYKHIESVSARKLTGFVDTFFKSYKLLVKDCQRLYNLECSKSKNSPSEEFCGDLIGRMQRYLSKLSPLLEVVFYEFSLSGLPQKLEEIAEGVVAPLKKEYELKIPENGEDPFMHAEFASQLIETFAPALTGYTQTWTPEVSSKLNESTDSLSFSSFGVKAAMSPIDRLQKTLLSNLDVYKQSLSDESKPVSGLFTLKIFKDESLIFGFSVRQQAALLLYIFDCYQRLGQLALPSGSLADEVEVIKKELPERMKQISEGRDEFLLDESILAAYVPNNSSSSSSSSTQVNALHDHDFKYCALEKFTKLFEKIFIQEAFLVQRQDPKNKVNLSVYFQTRIGYLNKAWSVFLTPFSRTLQNQARGIVFPAITEMVKCFAEVNAENLSSFKLQFKAHIEKVYQSVHGFVENIEEAESLLLSLDNEEVCQQPVPTWGSATSLDGSGEYCDIMAMQNHNQFVPVMNTSIPFESPAPKIFNNNSCSSSASSSSRTLTKEPIGKRLAIFYARALNDAFQEMLDTKESVYSFLDLFGLHLAVNGKNLFKSLSEAELLFFVRQSSKYFLETQESLCAAENIYQAHDICKQAIASVISDESGVNFDICIKLLPAIKNGSGRVPLMVFYRDLLLNDYIDSLKAISKRVQAHISDKHEALKKIALQFSLYHITVIDQIDQLIYHLQIDSLSVDQVLKDIAFGGLKSFEDVEKKIESIKAQLKFCLDFKYG